jgi:hypothetical protein
LSQLLGRRRPVRRSLLQALQQDLVELLGHVELAECRRCGRLHLDVLHHGLERRLALEHHLTCQ